VAQCISSGQLRNLTGALESAVPNTHSEFEGGSGVAVSQVETETSTAMGSSGGLQEGDKEKSKPVVQGGLGPITKSKARGMGLPNQVVDRRKRSKWGNSSTSKTLRSAVTMVVARILSTNKCQ